MLTIVVNHLNLTKPVVKMLDLLKTVVNVRFVKICRKMSRFVELSRNVPSTRKLKAREI